MIEIIKEYFWIFFISMLPVVELRGAIPIGVGVMGLPMISTFIVAVLGNIIPVPFLILFSQRVLLWLSKMKRVGPFFQKIIDRATQKAKSMGAAELVGLFLFVAIPLPMTGAWTGSLIAAILQLDWKKAFLVIFCGVVAAGIIMSLASAGVFGALGYIFGFKS